MIGMVTGRSCLYYFLISIRGQLLCLASRGDKAVVSDIGGAQHRALDVCRRSRFTPCVPFLAYPGVFTLSTILSARLTFRRTLPGFSVSCATNYLCCSLCIAKKRLECHYSCRSSMSRKTSNATPPRPRRRNDTFNGLPPPPPPTGLTFPRVDGEEAAKFKRCVAKCVAWQRERKAV